MSITPQQKTPAQVIDIAKIGQMMAAQEAANQAFIQGGSLDPRLPLKIYMERMALQNLYDKTPNHPDIQNVANYVYSLLGDYAARAESLQSNIALGAPVVTGPGNQTVVLGNTATFTIAVTSALPYTIAWYKNGVLVPGVTGLVYSFTPVLGDSGAVINAFVTNPAGITSSATGTLNVTNVLQGDYFYGDIDHYAELLAGSDEIPYNGTFSITHNAAFVVPFPLAAANNRFNGIRFPASEPDKTIWNNTVQNNGQIPDQVYRPIITIGTYKYIITRTAASLDSTNQQVTFS